MCCESFVLNSKTREADEGNKSTNKQGKPTEKNSKEGRIKRREDVEEVGKCGAEVMEVDEMRKQDVVARELGGGVGTEKNQYAGIGRKDKNQEREEGQNEIYQREENRGEEDQVDGEMEEKMRIFFLFITRVQVSPMAKPWAEPLTRPKKNRKLNT